MTNKIGYVITLPSLAALCIIPLKGRHAVRPFIQWCS